MTRRALLGLATGAGLAASWRLDAASPKFWDKKPPTEWTEDEIDELLTRSPWAKQVTGERPFERPGQGGRGGGMQLPGGVSLPGMGGGRGGRGGQGGRGNAAPLKGTVRWESAKPVLEALKTKLPETFADRYVFSVNGLPLGSNGSSESSDEVLDRIKALTSLEPKGKPLAQRVESQVSTGAPSLLFGFAKDLVTLDAGVTEATFSTQLGNLTVKAKFNLKEMLYRGELAV